MRYEEDRGREPKGATRRWISDRRFQMADGIAANRAVSRANGERRGGDPTS